MDGWKIALRVACGLALMALGTGQASAQAWIGQVVGQMAANEAARQQEAACRRGEPMSGDEETEARTPSLATMNAYWEAASAGRSFAGQFHLDKNARWRAGDTVALAGQIATQADPFVRAGLTLEPTHIGFVRASDGRSALGQWIVRDASGARRGTYTATFTRKSGEWRFSTLTLSGAGEYAEPVVQYCHVPNDVLTYRIDASGAERARLEREIAKGERRLEKQTDVVAAAREKAARRGASQMDQFAVREESSIFQRLSENQDALRARLVEVLAEQEDALADARARDAAKAAALRAQGES